MLGIGFSQVYKKYIFFQGSNFILELLLKWISIDIGM